MFHTQNFLIQNKPVSRVFIHSKYIKAFPCSRRRSTIIDTDGSETTPNDKYYIPFDPEARLNTEANNRKHSGLNGFRQSYIYDWDQTNGLLIVVLDGYYFEIQLPEDYRTYTAFGDKLNFTNDVFVNIGVEAVEFFGGTNNVEAAATQVLRDQTATTSATGCLDLFINSATAVDKSDPSNYYFSGLSLTSTDISKEKPTENLVSLHLLEKSGDEWQLYNPSRLPVISHGNSENSIRVGIVEADSVKLKNNAVASGLVIVPYDEENGIYQLQFTTR